MDEKINQLKALLGRTAFKSHSERFSFSMWPRGFSKGTLVELTGFGKTRVVVQFLAENPHLRVAWIEDQLTIYPCAVAQRKGVLSQILFVEANQDVLWASFQILRSHLFECVVICSQKNFDEKNLRRLQLESEKSHASIFFLMEKPHKLWPISLELKVQNDNLEALREKSA